MGSLWYPTVAGLADLGEAPPWVVSTHGQEQGLVAVVAADIWNGGRSQRPSLQALKVHVPKEWVLPDISSPFLLAAQPLL